ncbi:hypothetical protein PVT67_14455 [Gallaecimonas kandeliae]|uniref:SDH family Clp fold serine proteinase n=1 Tax=Gallaecimonas kandeliae TaxID=3029055 RepID=UPI0026487197|nr:hypothetical protein [Gallaecimonas kandeliae]WKE64855.1 hypothetical protein PVT67_14455 [Gallaecimonas kandeliae]
MTTDLGPGLRELEQCRRSKALVLCASHLDLDLLPRLHDCLRQLGKVERLDVLLQARGGEVNASRRIALLLRKHCDHLGFIVPFHCQSAATLLTLAGDEILAGDLALFSPIDPLLHGGGADGTPSALSCQDIRRFGSLCQDWFGLDQAEAQQQALALLCQSVFPPTLTAFYRSTQEVKAIAKALLTFQLPGADEEARERIVETLMFGYHSHDYALTGEELQALGLNLCRDAEAEALAWQLSVSLQDLVGGGLRQGPEAPWHDALIATNERQLLRTRTDAALLGQWEERGSAHG